MVKVVTALVLAVLMAVGSVANVVGAVIDQAQFGGGDAVIASAAKGAEIADLAAATDNAVEADADAEAPAEDAEASSAPFYGIEENEAVARVKDDLAATGDTTYYLHIGAGSAFRTTSGNACTYDSTNSYYYCDYAVTANTEYVLVINTTSGTLSDSNKSSSSQTVTSLATGWNATGATFDYNYYGSNNYDGYDAFKFKCRSSITIRFTFTSTFANGVTYRLSSGGSSSTDEYYLYGHQFGGWSWNTSTPTITKMTQDSDTGYYYVQHTVSQTSGGSYDNGEDYYRIWNKTTGKHYGVGSDTQVVLDGAKQTATIDTTSKAFWINDGNTGVSVGTKVKVWYDADNTKTWITTDETTHNVTFSAGTGGSISPSGTAAVGETTATSVTATASTGYRFSSWTNGNGITQKTNTSSGDNQTQTITTKASGTYTVRANFTKKSYTVSYTPTTMATDHGTFTVTKTSDGSAVASGTSLEYQTGLTVTATPDTGYQLGSVTVSPSATVSGSGNTRTFSTPAGNATITVTFTRKALSVSKSTNPAGKGSVVTTCGGTTYANMYYIGDNLSLSTTVSDNAYTVSSYTLIYGDGTRTTIEGATGTTGAIDATHYGTDGAISIIANMTKKPTYKVTVKTTSPLLGTAVANVTEAYQGQTVTLTATENTGTFTKWTVESGTASGVNDDTNKTKSFTMGSGAVTIKANFAEYSADSNFYYNSYGSDGQPAATHYGARMTEAKLGGETYSYYHVTGRSETEQLFTVSYKSPVYNNYNTYFELYSSWENGGVSAQFYASDGNNLGDYTNMTYDTETSDKKKFKIAIPDGARSVRFKNNNGGATTNEMNFADGNNGWYTNGSNLTDLQAYNSSNPVPNGFWENFNSAKYTNAFSSGGFNNHNANRGASHSYTKPNNLDESQRGNYYVLVLYKNKTYTINGSTKTISNDPEIIWLPTLPSSYVDDTKTVDIYAKNGSLRDSTFNRFTNLANTDFDTAYFEYTETLDSGVYTYTSIEDYNASGLHTPIVCTNDVSGYNSTYAKMTNVPVGAKIKIKTTLSSDSSAAGSFDSKAFKDSHYLKAYSFNGKSYQINTWNSSGVYEEVWTVSAVNTTKTSGGTTTNLTKDGRTVEVTPIYYMKDNSNCKTFYIDGYDGAVQSEWGNLLSVYPYYEGKSNKDNAFGGYPGQPMLFWGGKYQMEIPLTVDGTANGATVKGLTLHNDYWDLLHRDLDLVAKKQHSQTYDFDDFYKLYKEKNPDTIIYDFKYQKSKDNFSDGYDYTNYTFASGSATMAANDSSIYQPEILTDYFGRQVDVFGTLIADNKQSNYTTGANGDELLIVSTGYKDTYVGEYATMWAVYAPQTNRKNGESAGAFIGYIAPSMLYLNSIDRVSQYTDGTSTADGRMSWGNSTNKGFKYTYEYLKEYYKGVPAVISYDREIWNDSKDKANRSDGKWYYSNKSDRISANIKIQYCDTAADVVNKEDKALNDAVWTDDAFTGTGMGGETNVASHTSCSAYFTNTTPYLKGKTDSGFQFSDSTKKFTFEAVPSGSYLFVNWVRLSNGKYYEVSESELAESPMSSNDTYIARFVKSTNGSLRISHVVEQNGVYTGTGTPSVTVTVTNGTTQVFSETKDDGTPIDISRFMNTKYHAYKIDISLSTAPDEDSTLHDITNGSGIAKYNPGALSGNAATVTQFTVEDALEGANAVTTLRYVSHLSTIVYTYNYSIRYTYESRFWGDQYYDVTGTLVSSDPKQIGNITGKMGTAQLTTDFIISKTPYEKNFRQQINWNYTYEAVGEAPAMTNSAVAGAAANTYDITATVGSSNTIDDRVSADIMLPYPHKGAADDYAADTVVAHHSENNDETTYDEYIYDESQEPVTINTQAYKLFTTDGSVPAQGSSVMPSTLHLIEAAPYVWKNPEKRYVTEDNMRYYTGTYFTIGTVCYYYGDTAPDPLPAGASTSQQLTVSNTAAWTLETGYTGSIPSSYTYAVTDTKGTADTSDDEVYSFMLNGANGQYTVTKKTQSLDGFYMYDGSGDLTGVKKYFTRWDVHDTNGNYIASSYNRRFNFSGYQNYRVTAIYESDTPNPAADSNVANIPSISYLGDTRNQWTAGGQGSAGSVYNNASSGGDKLMHDFAISYDYYEEELRQVANEANGGRDIKIGMFIEQCGALETDVYGNKNNDVSYYADIYKDTYDAGAIENYLEGTINGSALKTALSARNIVHSKIGANVSGWGKLFSDTSGNIGNGNDGIQVIDNMNRLQWYYTFTNTKTEGEIGATNNANFVYRASAYIIDNGEATVSSVPVYFTLYDSASR